MAQKRKTSQKRKSTSAAPRRNYRRSPAKSEQEINREKEIIGIIIIAISVLLILSFIFVPDETSDEIGTFGFVSLYIIKVLHFFCGVWRYCCTCFFYYF